MASVPPAPRFLGISTKSPSSMDCLGSGGSERSLCGKRGVSTGLGRVGWMGEAPSAVCKFMDEKRGDGYSMFAPPSPHLAAKQGSNVGRGAGVGKLSAAGGAGWWGPAQEETPTCATLLHGHPLAPTTYPTSFRRVWPGHLVTINLIVMVPLQAPARCPKAAVLGPQGSSVPNEHEPVNAPAGGCPCGPGLGVSMGRRLAGRAESRLLRQGAGDPLGAGDPPAPTLQHTEDRGGVYGALRRARLWEAPEGAPSS